MEPDKNKPGEEAGAAGGGDDMIKTLKEQVAQLSEAAKTRDAQFDALKETYERTNALLQTMVDNGGRAGGGGGAGARSNELKLSRDYAGEFQIPNEAVAAIVQETLGIASREFDNRFISMQQVAKERDAFYKDNPDLVGSEFLVGSLSVQVDQELPNKSKAERFKEVASRARSVIKRYQDARSAGDRDVDQPAGAGGASHEGAGAGAGGGGTEDRPMTSEQELSAEVAERNKFRGSRLSRR